MKYYDIVEVSAEPSSVCRAVQCQSVASISF